MPLAKMKDLLANAEKLGYAVGSFSVANLEMIQGTIKAAEKLDSPILLQIAEVRLKYSPLEIIGPAMVSAAVHAKVPVGVHFDHGLTMKSIALALDLGFTSIMFDGSRYPFKENVRLTSKAAAVARHFSASVEAEIGHVGGSEDNLNNLPVQCTDPEEAKQFASLTDVDALAVAIGNAHGVYRRIPKLNYDILEAINHETGTPLVLHGGTGVGKQGFKKCISLGVRKINVATATLNAVAENVKKLCLEKSDTGYYDLHEAEVLGAYESVIKHIEIFGSKGMA